MGFRTAGGFRRAGVLRTDRPVRLLVAAVAILASFVVLPVLLRPSPAVDRWALAGPRGAGCVREVGMVDVSGSTADQASERDEAERRIVAWAPRNLRSGDELAVVAFDHRAAVQLAPVHVGRPADVRPAGIGGGGTLLVAAADAVAALPRTRCSTAAVVISDGRLADPPAEVRSALARAGVHRVALVLVGGAVPAAWSAALPDAPVFAAGTTADSVSVAVARATATFTGQRLVRR